MMVVKSSHCLFCHGMEDVGISIHLTVNIRFFLHPIIPPNEPIPVHRRLTISNAKIQDSCDFKLKASSTGPFRENMILFRIPQKICLDCRGRDRMVVGFTTAYVLSAYHHWCCEFESLSRRGVQHYVIKFVSDLRQVGGFLRVLRFPPPIKLTATI
jgi:hypothetical protein